MILCIYICFALCVRFLLARKVAGSQRVRQDHIDRQAQITRGGWYIVCLVVSVVGGSHVDGARF